MDNLCIQNYRNEIDAHYGIPQVRRLRETEKEGML